jgi:hypothetical protein
VRLGDLNDLRAAYLEQIRSNACGDSEQRAEFRSMAKGLVEILGAARDEVEGKGITFNQLNVTMVEFDGKSDAELVARRQELIAQAERALNGRPAGINNNPEGKWPNDFAFVLF